MDKDHLSEMKKKAKELEDILLETNEVKVKQGGQVLPPITSCAKPLDYDKIKRECDDKSDSIVDSIVSLYIPEEFAKNHDYVHEKMSVDKMTLSSLLFQMITAEHAIKRLLEEIDAANVNQKSFSDLGGLQKSKMEIIKHFAAFMVTMENNYKSLKFDYHSNTVENHTAISQNSSISAFSDFDINNNNSMQEETMTKFRGTKNLMASIQSDMKNIEYDSNATERE